MRSPSSVVRVRISPPAIAARVVTTPVYGPDSALRGWITMGMHGQDFVNGATVMRLSAVPTTYDLVAVAFANATTTPGAVSYDVDSGLSSALGGYTDADFTSDIATLHSRGQKVIISVGGANGTISVADSASATNFANSVNNLNLTGNGVTVNGAFTANAANLSSSNGITQGAGGVITATSLTTTQTANNKTSDLTTAANNVGATGPLARVPSAIKI